MSQYITPLRGTHRETGLNYAAPFAIVMLLWAVLPGPGLAAVVARALGSGARAGFAVIAGLVAADIVFMAVAILGLSAIAAALGPMFQIVKYAGAAYLVWRGYRAIADAAKPTSAAAGADSARWRDAGLGLLVTLGNPKAILFFGALFPALLDVTAVGPADFLVLSGIAAGVSCVVYGGCIVVAERTRRLIASTVAVKRLKQATGTLLIGSGIMVATR